MSQEVDMDPELWDISSKPIKEFVPKVDLKWRAYYDLTDYYEEYSTDDEVEKAKKPP